MPVIIRQNVYVQVIGMAFRGESLLHVAVPMPLGDMRIAAARGMVVIDDPTI